MTAKMDARPQKAAKQIALKSCNTAKPRKSASGVFRHCSLKVGYSCQGFLNLALVFQRFGLAAFVFFYNGNHAF